MKTPLTTWTIILFILLEPLSYILLNKVNWEKAKAGNRIDYKANSNLTTVVTAKSAGNVGSRAFWEVTATMVELRMDSRSLASGRLNWLISLGQNTAIDIQKYRFLHSFKYQSG